jgi:hypothetical protein
MREVIAALMVAALLVPTASAEERKPTDTNQFWLSQAVNDAVRKEGVRLAARSRTVLRQHQSPQRNWIKRHPVIFGTLVGFAAGTAGGAIACSNVGNPEEGCPYAVILGGIGAGAGALAGALVGLAFP